MKLMLISDFNRQRLLIASVLFLGLFLLFSKEILVALTYVVGAENEIWQIGYDVVLLLFPLFCIVPCLSLFEEKKSGYMRIAMLRMSIKSYFKTKFIYGSSVSFLMCFLISFVGLLFCYLIPESIMFIGEPSTTDNFAYKLFSENPLVYGFILSVWRGIVGVLFYFFGVVIVFLSNNKFLVVVIPFIYYHMENYFWAILDIYQTRTMYSIGLDTAGIDTSLFGFAIWGPVILCCILFIAYLFFIRNKIFILIK